MRTFSKIFLISLFCFIGCEKSDQTEPKLFSLRMARTQCRGNCPIYNLSVESDGKVVFEGVKFTQTIGKAESQLNDEKIKGLIEEIKKAKFFTFKDDYSSQSKNCTQFATDGPGAVLSIKFNEQEKNINHSTNCFVIGWFSNEDKLKPLTVLENKIDEIVETKRWIGEGK